MGDGAEDQDNNEIQESSQPKRESEHDHRRALVSLHSSSFFPSILQEPMEKMPTCKYDNKIVPEDHISAYEVHVLL